MEVIQYLLTVACFKLIGDWRFPDKKLEYLGGDAADLIVGYLEVHRQSDEGVRISIAMNQISA